MSMFETYTGDQTTTSNIVTENSYLKPQVVTEPFEDRNAAGVLVGYFWYYGDTLNLKFTISGEIIDDTGAYITAEDYLTDAAWSDKKIIFKLYNFRHEPIYSKVITDITSAEVVIEINQELSNELERGVYYCSLELIDNLYPYTITLFDESYCTLTVK